MRIPVRQNIFSRSAVGNTIHCQHTYAVISNCFSSTNGICRKRHSSAVHRETTCNCCSGKLDGTKKCTRCGVPSIIGNYCQWWSCKSCNQLVSQVKAGKIFPLSSWIVGQSHDSQKHQHVPRIEVGTLNNIQHDRISCHACGTTKTEQFLFMWQCPACRYSRNGVCSRPSGKWLICHFCRTELNASFLDGWDCPQCWKRNSVHHSSCLLCMCRRPAITLRLERTGLGLNRVILLSTAFRDATQGTKNPEVEGISATTNSVDAQTRLHHIAANWDAIEALADSKSLLDPVTIARMSSAVGRPLKVEDMLIDTVHPVDKHTVLLKKGRVDEEVKETWDCDLCGATTVTAMYGYTCSACGVERCE